MSDTLALKNIHRKMTELMKGPLPPNVYALFGHPVVGNPTQYMIERTLDYHGVIGQYISVDVDRTHLEYAIQGFRAMRFAGAHITVPHKVEVISFLDKLTLAAQYVGAVNCLYWEDNILVGDNTDGKGFLQSYSELSEVKGKNIVILGAGGAAKAIAVELAFSGANTINIVNRSEMYGEELSLKIRTLGVNSSYFPWKGVYVIPENIDLLINATSIGLNEPGKTIPVDLSNLHRSSMVADVVFNPMQTQFLVDAKNRGHKTLDGLGMLVNQGAIAFQLWTGVSPNIAVMQSAIREAFAVNE